MFSPENQEQGSEPLNRYTVSKKEIAPVESNTAMIMPVCILSAVLKRGAFYSISGQ